MKHKLDMQLEDKGSWFYRNSSYEEEETSICVEAIKALLGDTPMNITIEVSNEKEEGWREISLITHYKGANVFYALIGKEEFCVHTSLAWKLHEIDLLRTGPLWIKVYERQN